ncbi:hypothetical protein BH23GEM6_BH23GEM6_09820 [soil metagenome]
MMNSDMDVQSHLAAAHSEALAVGDSPLRADRLALKLVGLTQAVNESDLDEDVKNRIRVAVNLAERVLRRDDDGREAARHLQAALALLKPRQRKPSPFADDSDD